VGTDAFKRQAEAECPLHSLRPQGRDATVPSWHGSDIGFEPFPSGSFLWTTVTTKKSKLTINK